MQTLHKQAIHYPHLSNFNKSTLPSQGQLKGLPEWSETCTMVEGGAYEDRPKVVRISMESCSHNIT